MYENKKTSKGIYYSRYIASWLNATDGFIGVTFKNWLKHEGCTEAEVEEIYYLARNGKMELENSAKKFVAMKRETINVVDSSSLKNEEVINKITS